MKKQLTFFLTFFFCIFCFADEVIFFDVGQGNCTLVQVTGQPLLLVDAGSTNFRDEGESFKTQQVGEIQKKIKLNLGRKKIQVIKVIVTHGDIDHYSWIKEIFPANRNEIYEKTIKLDVLCGGKRSDYPHNFGNDFIISGDNIQYAEDNKHSSYFDRHSPFQILSAKVTGNKNENSIVLKCNIGQYSVLLTGDATGKTVRDIKPKDAKADIMQMSHHGATSEEANSKQWVQKVQPKVAICSSGTRKDYPHPDANILDSLQYTQLHSTMPVHLFRSHKKHTGYTKLDIMRHYDSLEPFLYFSDNYILYITTKAIYNTTDAGDITITVTNGNLQITTDRGQQFSHPKHSEHIPLAIEDCMQQLLFRFNLSDFRLNSRECLAVSFLPNSKALFFLSKDFLVPSVGEINASKMDFSGYTPEMFRVFLERAPNLRRFKTVNATTNQFLSDQVNPTISSDLDRSLAQSFGLRGIR